MAPVIADQFVCGSLQKLVWRVQEEEEPIVRRFRPRRVDENPSLPERNPTSCHFLDSISLYRRIERPVLQFRKDEVVFVTQ